MDHVLSPPTLTEVQAARETIAAHLQPTPLVFSELLSERLGCEYWIKCENLQPVGAFKVRGGVNLTAHLPAREREAGVVAASTGNHGQSLAWAGRRFGVPVTIFVPAEQTNPLKVQAMERLGARVRRVGRDFDEAREACEAEAERSGARYVHSANEPRLVAGVGTMALETLDTLPDVDVILVPVGGGSGAAGHGVVLRELAPRVELIGVQSAEAPGVERAWRTGSLEPHPRMESVHEGLATRVPFALTLELLRETLSDFIVVPDREIDRAVALLAREAKLVAEGAGAASLAAALRLRERLARRKVVGVLSGGNLPLERLRELLGALPGTPPGAG
jgi:threonine dehydratase